MKATFRLKIDQELKAKKVCNNHTNLYDKYQKFRATDTRQSLPELFYWPGHFYTRETLKLGDFKQNVDYLEHFSSSKQTEEMIKIAEFDCPSQPEQQQSASGRIKALK